MILLVYSVSHEYDRHDLSDIFYDMDRKRLDHFLCMKMILLTLKKNHWSSVGCGGPQNCLIKYVKQCFIVITSAFLLDLLIFDQSRHLKEAVITLRVDLRDGNLEGSQAIKALHSILC